MTFHLDYSRRSDLDDSVGYWYVEPTGRTTSRVFYSCECKLRGWVPPPVYSLLTKEALTKVCTPRRCHRRRHTPHKRRRPSRTHATVFLTHTPPSYTHTHTHAYSHTYKRARATLSHTRACAPFSSAHRAHPASPPHSGDRLGRARVCAGVPRVRHQLPRRRSPPTRLRHARAARVRAPARANSSRAQHLPTQAHAPWLSSRCPAPVRSLVRPSLRFPQEHQAARASAVCEALARRALARRAATLCARW